MKIDDADEASSLLEDVIKYLDKVKEQEEEIEDLRNNILNFEDLVDDLEEHAAELAAEVEELKSRLALYEGNDE